MPILTALALLGGCRVATSDTDTPITDTSAPCPEALLPAATQYSAGGTDMRLGTALLTLPRDGSTPLLVMSAPTSLANYEAGASAYVYVHEAPFDGSFGQGAVSSVNVDVPGIEDIYSRLGSSLVAPGDLTGDGVEDLVLIDDSRSYQLPGNVYVVPGPHDTGLHRRFNDPGMVPLERPGTVLGARCGDVDGDGRADLCLTSGISSGPVTTASTQSVTWSSLDAHAIAAADLDGDGNTELLLWDDLTSTLWRLDDLSPGDRSPSSGWVGPGGSTVRALTTADADGDGTPDFAIGVADGETHRTYVVTNPDPGPLEDALVVVEGPVDALLLTDLDDDGATDLLIGGGDDVRVFLGPLVAGVLDGSCPSMRWLSRDFTATDYGPEYPTGFGKALVAADFDEDGHVEVVVGEPDWGFPNLAGGYVHVVEGGPAVFDPP